MPTERSHARIFTYFGALIFLVALASPSGYLGDISTNTNGNGQFQPGYPREFIVSLHAEF